MDAMKHHIDETEAKVASLTSELQQAHAKFAQDLAEATEERASIKERMNEAIQERWIAEEQLKKIEIEREKAASGGPSGASTTAGLVELETKIKFEDFFVPTCFILIFIKGFDAKDSGFGRRSKESKAGCARATKEAERSRFVVEGERSRKCKIERSVEDAHSPAARLGRSQ